MGLALGIVFGLTYLRGVLVGRGTPILTWDGGTSDTEPDFFLDLLYPVVGDTVYLQYDNNSDFSSPIATLSNVLDSSEIGVLELSFATGVLANGTYYFRAKHNTSEWSNTETVTITAVSGTPIGLLLLLTH
jgi:hypothetical protein